MLVVDCPRQISCSHILWGLTSGLYIHAMWLLQHQGFEQVELKVECRVWTMGKQQIAVKRHRCIEEINTTLSSFSWGLSLSLVWSFLFSITATAFVLLRELKTLKFHEYITYITAYVAFTGQENWQTPFYSLSNNPHCNMHKRSQRHPSFVILQYGKLMLTDIKGRVHSVLSLY